MATLIRVVRVSLVEKVLSEKGLKRSDSHAALGGGGAAVIRKREWGRKGPVGRCARAGCVQGTAQRQDRLERCKRNRREMGLDPLDPVPCVENFGFYSDRRATGEAL